MKGLIAFLTGWGTIWYRDRKEDDWVSPQAILVNIIVILAPISLIAGYYTDMKVVFPCLVLLIWNLVGSLVWGRLTYLRDCGESNLPPKTELKRMLTMPSPIVFLLIITLGYAATKIVTKLVDGCSSPFYWFRWRKNPNYNLWRRLRREIHSLMIETVLLEGEPQNKCDALLQRAIDHKIKIEATLRAVPSTKSAQERYRQTQVQINAALKLKDLEREARVAELLHDLATNGKDDALASMDGRQVVSQIDDELTNLYKQFEEPQRE